VAGEGPAGERNRAGRSTPRGIRDRAAATPAWARVDRAEIGTGLIALLAAVVVIAMLAAASVDDAMGRQRTPARDRRGWSSTTPR
jgi:hypothetical protein